MSIPRVSKEVFLLIAETWYTVKTEALDDPKACMAMGLVEKHLAPFLKWLSEHEKFQDIKDVTLEDFILTMNQIAPFTEAGLKKLLTEMRKNEANSS